MVNESPPSTTKVKTLEEIWTSVPANYKHLKIFKFPAYVCVKHEKFIAKALKQVFVDYLNGVKGYKV